MSECALMIAFATVLSFIKLYEAPLGGAVTLMSMAPIILISDFYGIKWGLASGFVFSVIQLILGLGNVAYLPTPRGIILCILFDYIIAYTVIGIAGAFRNLKISAKPNINAMMTTAVSIIAAGTLRLCSHIVSGAVVWYEITKEQNWNEYVHTVGMWTYSLVYNISYMLPEIAITLVAAPIIAKIIMMLKKSKKDNTI